MLLSRTAWFQGAGLIRRPAGDLAWAFVAGGALAAPLALPGFQLAHGSIRTTSAPISALPIVHVWETLSPTYWGQPIAGSFANAQGLFPSQMVYVGAIAVVLSITAAAIRWRRPEVAALVAAAVVALAASVIGPVDRILDSLPLIGQTWWYRSVIPLAFCLAILGAIGLDTVLRKSERRRATQWALGAFGALALVLVLVWLFGRGHLPAYAADVRAKSFLWPAVSTAVGLAAFAVLRSVDRRPPGRRWSPASVRWLTIGVVGSLLMCQTVLLVVAEAPLPSSSPIPYQPTAAVTALQRQVGSSLVGLGVKAEETGGLNLGFVPNANIPFGVHQFAEYDPIAPISFFTAWSRINQSSPGASPVYFFIPGITSATVARRYGVSYVLEAAGAAGPVGAVFDAHVGNEDLYRIPGAATATLVPAEPSGGWPPIDAKGAAVPVTTPSPSQVRVVTNASSPQVLRLRVASFPGWKATIDGRPLALSRIFRWRSRRRSHRVDT